MKTKEKTSIKLLTVILLLTFGLFNTITAQKIISLSDGAWESPAVWSGGVVPDEESEVTILHHITKSGDLKPEGNGSVIIEQRGQLEVAEKVHNYGTIVVRGTLTVERYFRNHSNYNCSGTTSILTYKFENKETGIGVLTGTMNCVKFINYNGQFTNTGIVNVTDGELQNKGTISGPCGVFNVIGDVKNEGVIQKGPVYLCQTRGDLDEDGIGTFTISCGPYDNCGTPFEIKFEEFYGLSQEGSVMLRWEVGVAENLAFFEIQRAASSTSGDCVVGSCTPDPNSFQTIGRVDVGASKQQFSYSYQDKNPAQGVNFYRVRAVDSNNGEYFSTVIEILNQSEGVELLAYPNPCNGNLNIWIMGEEKQSSLKIYDMGGRIVWQQNMGSSEMGLKTQINIRDFASGAYILELVQGNARQTKKLIFQK